MNDAVERLKASFTKCQSIGLTADEVAEVVRYILDLESRKEPIGLQVLKDIVSGLKEKPRAHIDGATYYFSPSDVRDIQDIVRIRS